MDKTAVYQFLPELKNSNFLFQAPMSLTVAEAKGGGGGGGGRALAEGGERGVYGAGWG